MTTNRKDLAGKTAVVTGAGRGIGKAIAVALAARGADVVVNDICTEKEADDVISQIEQQGSAVLFVQANIGDRPSVDEMFDRVTKRFGHVDILINNAALSIRKPLIELEVAEVERVWAVALWGVFHCTQVAARLMVAQKTGGAIVSISSVHASRPFPRSTAYNGAKAAVNHMSATWAAELAQYGIRVNVIEPGWIDTPGERNFVSDEQIIEEGKKLPLGRLGRPEEIAEAVCFLVSDQGAYMTGSVMRVDGGFVLPR